MTIRAARDEDAAAIRRVVEAAFGSPAEADLVEQLGADGDAVLSLVAVEEGQVLGHVLFSRMEAPFAALALAPVAVLPARQGRGIGSALIREGLARAADGGWRGVFVLGEPAYYGRFGFDARAASGFASPYAGPYFMVAALGGALPRRTGAVVHAPAFGRLGE